MINTLVKPEIFVSETELEKVIVELENQKPIPFVGVTIKNKNHPSELVLKSKIDGSKNPYWKQVTKVSTKTYLLVVDFKKRVIGNLDKEGKEPSEYKEGKLSGKKHLTKSILTDTETETERYVMLEWFPETKGKSSYFFEGNELDKKILENWLTFRDKTSNNQGSERNVEPITPSLSSIQELNVNGVRYIVKH